MVSGLGLTMADKSQRSKLFVTITEFSLSNFHIAEHLSQIYFKIFAFDREMLATPFKEGGTE